jgi:penicillin-binding protein-related factor A (putative recombinase)
MKEATIIKQVMDNWKRQHPYRLWAFKVPDYSHYYSNHSNNRAVDVLACYDGVFVGMEWKIKKDKRAFPFDRVRDNQVQALCDIGVAGGVGLLMIVVYHGPQDKYAYAIPIEVWNECVFAAQGKSVRIEEEFAQWRIEPKKHGAYVHWDMTKIEELCYDAKRRS